MVLLGVLIIHTISDSREATKFIDILDPIMSVQNSLNGTGFYVIPN